MANYALITGTALETIDLYSDVVRSEGIEAVLVSDPEETRRIVSEKGKPRLVIADLEMARDSGFKLLREVQGLFPAGDRPTVLAAVSRELRTTAGDLMDALGITEVLPIDANARSLCATLRRVLVQDTRPGTEPCQPPVAVDEADPTRLARVASTELDDSPSDKALDTLVAQTSEAFTVPFAIASLTLDDGHWFKSHVNPANGATEARNLSFDASFCSYIAEAGHPVFVADAAVHPKFAANPLVRKGIVGTFAGAPLVTRDGDAVGAICILDKKRGSISTAKADLLARLARRVAEDIERRSKARASALEVIRLTEKIAQDRDKHRQSRAQLAQLEAVFAQLDGGIIVIDREQRVVFVNRAAGELLDVSAHRMTGISRDELLRECSTIAEDPEGFLTKISPIRIGLKAFTCEIELERPVQRFIRWSVKPIELPEGMGQLVTVAEVESPVARAVSGRYSVVPPLASTRPSRAASARAAAPARAAKRKS
jgi:PAS domain-containing protein